MLPLQDSSSLQQAPCVRGGRLLTLPGPQPRTQALQTGEGRPHCWARFSPSSRLNCSFSAPTDPPLSMGHRWAGAWVSRSSSFLPPQVPSWPWVTSPWAGARVLSPQQSRAVRAVAAMPQSRPWGAERAFGESAEPFLLQGWAGHRGAPYHTMSPGKGIFGVKPTV